MNRYLTVGVLSLALLVTACPAPADDPNTISGDKATDMIVDLLVVRPVGLATTIVGTALTIVALPFTIPSGSVRESAELMIVSPAEYTFKRPLGQFDTDDPR
jgi:hypothetical protein